MQKILSVLLGLLLLASLMYSPTMAQTSDTEETEVAPEIPAFETFEHPSGAFIVNYPMGWLTQELEDGAEVYLFAGGPNQLMIAGLGPADSLPTDAEEAVDQLVANATFIIDDYTVLESETAANGSIFARFEFERLGETGLAELQLTVFDTFATALVLMTPAEAYDDVQASWAGIRTSFQVHWPNAVAALELDELAILETPAEDGDLTAPIPTVVDAASMETYVNPGGAFYVDLPKGITPEVDVQRETWLTTFQGGSLYGGQLALIDETMALDGATLAEEAENILYTLFDGDSETLGIIDQQVNDDGSIYFQIESLDTDLPSIGELYLSETGGIISAIAFASTEQAYPMLQPTFDAIRASYVMDPFAAASVLGVETDAEAVGEVLPLTTYEHPLGMFAIDYLPGTFPTSNDRSLVSFNLSDSGDTPGATVMLVDTAESIIGDGTLEEATLILFTQYLAWDINYEVTAEETLDDGTLFTQVSGTDSPAVAELYLSQYGDIVSVVLFQTDTDGLINYEVMAPTWRAIYANSVLYLRPTAWTLGIPVPELEESFPGVDAETVFYTTYTDADFTMFMDYPVGWEAQDSGPDGFALVSPDASIGAGLFMANIDEAFEGASAEEALDLFVDGIVASAPDDVVVERGEQEDGTLFALITSNDETDPGTLQVFVYDADPLALFLVFFSEGDYDILQPTWDHMYDSFTIYPVQAADAMGLN